MGSNLYRQLRQRSLEEELSIHRHNFEGVDRKYQRETNPVEKNALRLQRDDLLSEIKNIENELLDFEVNKEQELVKILQPLYQKNGDIFFSAYRTALPSRQIFEKNFNGLSFGQLVAQLQLFSSEKEYTPLQKFIGFLLLEHNLEIGLRKELEAWLSEEVEDFSSFLTEIEQVKQSRIRHSNPCLLVSVSYREFKYIVEAWIINHLEEYHSTQSVSDCHQVKINGKATWLTDQTLKNMPALLRKFRDVCATHYSEKPIYQIHMFLPSELISHHVDSWNRDEEDSELSMTFGEDYEVVVRYSERLRERTEAIHRWRERGRNMKQMLHQPAAKIFVTGNNEKPRRLQRQLIPDTSVAVKLTSTRQNDLGKLLFKFGIPVAVWIRNTISNVDCPTALDDLLEKCSELRKLPSQVQSMRLEAVEYEEPNDHIGRHITLLWDDPDLVPPKQLLSQHNL